MKHTETYDNFNIEKQHLTEIGHKESGDNRFMYSEIIYQHNITGEIWICVAMTDDRGGRTFHERYDDAREIQNIINSCNQINYENK